MPIGNALAVIRSYRPFPPIITSGDPVIWRVNQPDFNYLITAINNPETFNATPLPAGLSFDPISRTISGTPTVINVAGTNVTASATNRGGTGTKQLKIKVYPEPPDITSATYLSGIQDDPLTYRIMATNMSAAYLPSYGASKLPSGLWVNTTTGLISGTPLVEGVTFDAKISASNISGTDSETLVIEIKMPPPVITQPPNFTQAANTSFVYQILATNSPIEYPTTGLPPGLATNNATGEIVGTLPNLTTPQTYNVRVDAFNTTGYSRAPRNFTITVLCPPVITSATTLIGYTNESLNYNIIATNMQAIYTPSYDATNLPTGLTVNRNTGLISGTPSVAGTTVTNIVATNAIGNDTENLTIEIRVRPPVVTQPSSFTQAINTSFSYQIIATNNPTSYSATNLPAGLSLDPSTGLITGTLPNLTDNETYVITINASNDGGLGIGKTFNITVVAPPVISANNFSGNINTLITSSAATATNGPVTWSISNVPTFLLAARITNGIITGTGQNSTTELEDDITITATNIAGSASVSVRVFLRIPPPAPTALTRIIGTNLYITRRQGRTFSQQLTTDGTDTILTWTATGTNWPPGWTLSNTGLITGTFDQLGSWTMQVDVTNASTAGGTARWSRGVGCTINSTEDVAME